MSSGWLDSHRLRFNSLHQDSQAESEVESPSDADDVLPSDRLHNAIARTRGYLFEQQHDDGYWVGELQGDTILESEYILLLAFLGRHTSEPARLAANYMLEQQLPDGGWAMYPGGPLEISGSVKAYFALKLTGHSPEADYMVRAREAILRAGGAEKVNSFTRFYLALLGVISYDQCPAVPPEMILIPKWMPFNIYEMSSWSRTILVPLSLMWAHRPSVELPPELGIRELFCTSPEELSTTMGPSEVLDDLQSRTWIDWSRFFQGVDATLKRLERWRIKPLRRLAVRRAADWMIERFADSDGLGAIFPPIVWSVIALKCLGYDEDSPEVQAALTELDKLGIREGDTLRLQPCKSPVWDTAITTLALRRSGTPADHPAIRNSVNWLLSKEVRRPGDWSVNTPNVESGAWFFEFNNDFYPDVDDTAMVMMALRSCLPDERWSADFLVDPWSPHPNDQDAAAVLSGRGRSGKSATAEIDSLRPLVGAIHRGARWMLAMQSRNGGWGAFDVDNDREILTRVPFADHNAMIDPSTPDITARVVEMFAAIGLTRKHPAVARALEMVWSKQEHDGCWQGRWGVNYLYGTWQVLVGLAAIGVPIDDPGVRAAVRWLEETQQDCGGWGETPGSYDDPGLRGQGPPTASQTAWALMGLLAAGETQSDAVRRGVRYLLDTQLEDGTWREDEFTGTGFPRVFYLKYHMYRIYFPLMALGQYAQLKDQC
jgi:squalene-hopene/tetraprenyl-beta-curcumene cyclase